MSDTPKFEVIDRRKYKAAEEEREAAASQAKPESEPRHEAKPEPKPEPASEETRPGPQLVTEAPRATAAALGDELGDLEAEPGLPPAPTAEEVRQLKSAYDASAQRLEELIRAQNPGVGPQPVVTFDHLVNQLYVSAMIQMGAEPRNEPSRRCCTRRGWHSLS